MDRIRVSTQSAQIGVTVRSSAPVTLSVVPQAIGAQVALISSPGPKGADGDPGPDPWLEPIQTLAVSGAVTINYALGKHVRLTLMGDVTSLNVFNWPVTSRIARLTLEFINGGNFDILAWPPGTIWQSGLVAQITQGNGSRDRIILSTTDAGATVYGDPVGFDYR